MPKYHTNVNSFLTPILGLYGINIKDFVTEFENKTKFITSDIIVPLRVRISKIKTFEISFQTPYVSNIVRNMDEINVLTIYKLSLLKNVRMVDLGINDICITYKNIIEYTTLFIKTLNRSNKSIILNKKLPGFLKSNFVRSITSNILKKNLYGVFANFNNESSFLRERIKNQLAFYNIDFRRMNINNNSNFSSVYYLSSGNFGSLYHIVDLFPSKNLYSLFPLFYRFKSNIVEFKFLNDLMNSLDRKLPFFIRCNVFEFLIVLKKITNKLLKLVNANLSSVNKIS